MRPVVFSASSANTYLLCHLQWWFTYVLVEPAEPSEAQAVGIAVHDAAEFMLRETTGWQPSIDWLAAHDVTVMPHVASTISVFKRDILPTYGEILLVEEPFQVVVDGVPFSGIIDSLDGHDGTNILRDLKTTGSRPGAGRYRFNMVGYYLGVTEGLGHRVDAIQLDYIVRTKQPYYWPDPQPIPDDYEIAAWSATLAEIANGVERGEFSATGLGTWACNYCAYQAKCGPYQRYTNISPLREEVIDA